MQADSPFTSTSTSDTPGQRAAALLDRAAPTPATLLLLGESGVGKTRLAKWVHAHSPVSRRAFVTIEQLETEHIRRTLDQSKSLTAAAQLLGIDTSTLFRKRRRLGL